MPEVDVKVETRRVDLMALSPQDRNTIDEVLARSANATVFHTVEWNQLLIGEFGLRNVTLLATVGDTPAGLYSFFPLDNHLCRSPVVHLQSAYGGPITACGDAQVMAELLGEAERFRHIAFFQIWTPPNYDISPFVTLGYSMREMSTSMINLQGTEEELWARLHKDKRTKIRKAVKSDVHIVDGELSSLDAYHEMVAATLGKAGLEALPRSFYGRLLEHRMPQGMAKFLLAEYNREVISGAILLYFKDTVYAWDIGWRREYASVAPNDLLTWEIARRARVEGYKYFDLLRLEPDRLPSIAKWKQTFGGQVTPCYYLAKATRAYRLWRGLRVITNPRRLAGKLRSFTARRPDASWVEAPG